MENVESVRNFSKNLSSGCNRIKTGNINLIFLVQMSSCTSFMFATMTPQNALPLWHVTCKSYKIANLAL